ncbi:MAG: FAD-binding protein [Oscillospiraceae bacterium]
MFDILIIGGGAAGMYCAARAAETGLSAAVAEHGKSLGRKLGITGRGAATSRTTAIPRPC